MAYVRTVRTASGATAVQIVHGSHRGSKDVEHLGSAHDEVELAALKAAASQRIAAGQAQLDLGLDPGRGATGPLEIVGSRMGHLWDALVRAYEQLGLDEAAGGDEVFRALVCARVIEPTSKLDSLRVLAEVGVGAPSYRTVLRRLRGYSTPQWRAGMSASCAARAALGPAALVLYDVSTLYFEIDEGDGFRESGFSKERRLEPQITIGLLTDAAGFPLALESFEGNRAETTTMIPTITEFIAAHDLTDVTVVADAGMLSAANRRALSDAGLSYILGARIPDIPYQVLAWRKAHPGVEIGDGQVFTQPWPATANGTSRDETIYYQYRADRARRTLRGIDQQVSKAEKAVAGKTPVKRNRFITLQGGSRTVNRTLETKARALAGIKGYVTTMPDPTPDTVIGAYHQLWHVEKSFRMSKHDLRARPIYHHLLESIDAHLNIVFAALAVSRRIEAQTGWSIRRFVQTARRYRTVTIRAGTHTLTAEDPLPTDLRDALAMIT